MKLLFKIYFFSLLVFTLSLQAKTVSISLKECAKIDIDSTRLFCFDQLAKSFTPSSENTVLQKAVKENPIDVIQPKNPLLIISTEEKSQSDLIKNFGSAHLKQKALNIDEEKAIILTVESVKKGTNKKFYFTFENGHIWKQTNNEYFKIKSGEQVELKEGALGAIYLKKLDKNRSIRVKRVK